MLAWGSRKVLQGEKNLVPPRPETGLQSSVGHPTRRDSEISAGRFGLAFQSPTCGIVVAPPAA
jgi:hypothetical protein